MIKIIKKIVADHHKNWHNVFFNALWAYRVTPKASIGNSPFFLVCGKEAILPPNIFLPSLQLSQSLQEDECPTMQRKINTLIKLEKEREKTK